MGADVDGYSKEILRDLTVNRWRTVIIALVLFVVLLGLVTTQVASPLLLWVVIVVAVYLMASGWAAAGYALLRRADGSFPKSNGSLLLSIVVLLVPQELLR